MDSQEENIFRFDHDFYITTYTDIDSNEYNTQEKSLAHYLRWGKKEKRCCCYEEMVYKYKKNKTEAIEKINLFPKLENKKFNILIRTSSRPEYFKNCIPNDCFWGVYISCFALVCARCLPSISTRSKRLFRANNFFCS